MRLPLFVFHIGISHSLYRDTERGFLFVSDRRVVAEIKHATLLSCFGWGNV